MLRFSSAIFIALFSFSALARVSMEEKRVRVRFLEKLSKIVPALHIEGYHRELKYEEQNLSLDERAQNEANLMAEKIKQQVVQSYERSFAESSDMEQAKASVREAIDRDLELAEPGIRDTFKTIAYQALEDAANGTITSQDSENDPLQKYMKEEVTERSKFLNLEISSVANDAASPIANKSKDAERRSYKNKTELLESLASDRENLRWLSTASITTESAVARHLDADISYALKINFLGAEVSGGPKINFNRKFESKVVVLAEGLTPGVTADGQFDFNKRDRAGQIVRTGGKNQKRYISFFCDVKLRFSTDYSGGGNFSVAGLGGGVNYGHDYSSEVAMTSRRVLVPESIGNQTVTMQSLQKICMGDFLNTKVNNRLTVKQALNIQMRNVIASLRFSHPKTKCLRDEHCVRWFNSGMKGVVGNAAVPRCGEEPREKYFACTVRAVVNQKCPVYKNGKHVSDGMFEYQCDRGLYCKTVIEGGWFSNMKIFQYAEGRCTKRR